MEPSPDTSVGMNSRSEVNLATHLKHGTPFRGCETLHSLCPCGKRAFTHAYRKDTFKQYLSNYFIANSILTLASNVTVSGGTITPSVATAKGGTPS